MVFRESDDQEVMEAMMLARSPTLRNVLALYLSDHRVEASYVLIEDLIFRPKTKGARTTLVYALNQAGYKLTRTADVCKLMSDSDADSELVFYLSQNQGMA